MSRLQSICASIPLTAALVLGAAPALGEGPVVPASVAPAAPGQALVRDSFTAFAQTWLDKLQKKGGAVETQGSVTTRRQLDGTFTTELRPTGQASAPYVGLLRYTEHVYRCNGAGEDSCVVQAAIPVTEIFRYENGRWIY